MAKEEQPLNPFIYSDVFRTPDTSFLRKHKNLKDVLQKCIFVIDTNSLLVPFGVSTKGLADIRGIYQKLVKENRVFVPQQCAREFLKNRPQKIRELHEQIYRAVSSLPSVNEIPLLPLQGLKEHEIYMSEIKSLKEKIKTYKNSLETLSTAVKTWNFNDPISDLYSNVFTTSVFTDHSLKEDEIIKDRDRRFAHSLPPGYKDKAKDDGGIGDVAIWHAILNLGRTHKNDLVFVSNDEKSDWVVRASDQAISPRYELIDEFHRESHHEFFIVSFSQFLDLHGAPQPTVSQARESSLVDSVSSTANVDLDFKDTTRSDKFIHALEELGIELENYIASYDIGEDEYVYIRDHCVIQALDCAQSALSEEIKSEHYQPQHRGQLKKLSEIIQEIRSLNGALQYMEARMKRSGDEESKSQFLLCKQALHITRILLGISTRF